MSELHGSGQPTGKVIIGVVTASRMGDPAAVAVAYAAVQEMTMVEVYREIGAAAGIIEGLVALLESRGAEGDALMRMLGQMAERTRP